MTKKIPFRVVDAQIDITGVDPVKLVQTVYEMSKPVGLGFIHAKSGGLSEEQAKSLIDMGRDSRCVIGMDYVMGRQCKFDARWVGPQFDMLGTDLYWYDHTNAQYSALLTKLGVEGATV